MAGTSWDFSEITTNLERLSTELKPEAAVGLALAADFIGQASDQIVPLDQGPLQNSRLVSVDEDSLRAAVSYNTPYAVRQHEDLTLSHPGGRQAKFLETAFNRNVSKVGQIIAAHLRGAFR